MQVRVLLILTELVYSTAALALDSRTLLPGDKKLSLFKDSPTKLWEELGDHVCALLYDEAVIVCRSSLCGVVYGFSVYHNCIMKTG
mgnify:CR=1 FL=1